MGMDCCTIDLGPGYIVGPDGPRNPRTHASVVRMVTYVTIYLSYTQEGGRNTDKRVSGQGL